MNLLALVTDAFGGFGGIARYNRDLLAALTRHQGDTRIVVLPRLGCTTGVTLPPGVRQLTAHTKKTNYAAAALRAALTEGRYDAVFCGHLHMAALGAAIARLLRVPLWLQVHGVEAWGPLTRSRRWAVERASLITAVSRFTRHQLLRFAAIDPERVRVLPNAIGHDFAPGVKPDYLIERYRLHGKRILLTLGRLAPQERRKGHDLVVRALPALAAAHPDLVYVIAGPGEDRARLADLARQLGVADRVLFAGHVAPAELVDHYRLADVFVMPSTQEGFGIVFLEAAACGLPPIGGRHDGSIDALGDGAIGFAIDPTSADELVRAVTEALAGRAPNPAEVHRFDVENFTRQVLALTSSRLLGVAVPA